MANAKYDGTKRKKFIRDSTRRLANGKREPEPGTRCEQVVSNSLKRAIARDNRVENPELNATGER